MDIPVRDQDSLDAVPSLRVASGNGHVVEEAETHAPFRRGVMAWGPNGTEGVLGSPAHHRVHRGDHATDPVKGHGVALRTDGRVAGGQPGQSRRALSSHQVDVGPAVDQGDGVEDSLFRLKEKKLPVEGLLLDPALNGRQSLRAFRVCLPRLVPQEHVPGQIPCGRRNSRVRDAPVVEEEHSGSQRAQEKVASFHWPSLQTRSWIPDS